MASSFGFDRAELFGTLLETALFGPALLLAARTIKLVSGKHADTTNFIFKATPLIMILIATLHLAVDWHRLAVAFLEIQDLQDRVVFLNNLKDWSYVFKDGVYIIQTLIGDGILIYRCWIVWSTQRWIGAVPAVLFTATVVTGIGGIVLVAKSDSLFDGTLSRFITAFLISTIVTTVLSTGLILTRLWLSRRNSPFTRSMTSSGTLSFTPIILMLAETGALYTSVVIVVFATFWVGSASTIIFVNSLASLIVILFCAVLLQIFNNRQSAFSNRNNVSTFRAAAPRSTQHPRTNNNTDVEISFSQFELATHTNPDLVGANKHGEISHPSTGGDSTDTAAEYHHHHV